MISLILTISVEIPREERFTLESVGVTVPMLFQMLRRENELRLSPTVQEMYRDKKYGGYVAVTVGLQEQVT
jgi:hypothetical protein